MCISNDGKRIKCDGMECESTTAIPVALHSEPSSVPNTTQGWLYVLRGSESSHFCPKCAQKRLYEAQAGGLR